ncbi:methyltransferase [Galbitalea sp. SE-J8]|uniref:class I SAM-dependent methyltransferase n=1 Tax=Galbitalea sp. SE-J8 TaxID=3054952 RepID=UPI00259CF522|nr:methyltransferase [Galbitalea sp. SE-J8]MDM4762281.1 methyltransferase [Galbitalea sp. SE-J8]
MLLESLRRYPDVEADNLFAWDASDRLILARWSSERRAGVGAGAPAPSGPVSEGSELVVINDNYGALTLGAAAAMGAGRPAGAAADSIRVYQDDLLGELALGHNARAAGFTGYDSHPLDETLLAGARTVLMQLPRSLDELDDIARAIAAWAAPDVTVYAGGRIKHMTVAMNDVFLRYFDRVDVSLARQKSRVLTVTGGVGRVTPPVPREREHDGLRVAAFGGVFAGTSIDAGTRLLLTVLRRARPDARDAIDLGCGTGVLAASLALARPGLRVTATDQSRAAVASAARTAGLNGVADRVEVVRDDGLASRPDASADLIVLNPPFHIGAAVHTGLAQRMFADAARVLRPGGQLWTVFNSHLGYRRELARVVGPTDLVTHDSTFTVTASTKQNEKDSNGQHAGRSRHR